ncbi:undecaprenyl diphosphate synthase family protein [Microcystis aeruginosa]|nr:undecaprenyl diphosphate synthase family protein [Microcystis aeruginosa]MDB9412456.1 undecaprenyl diphosphate synthase family protein [Microcystis aeruginosa CS-567/02]MDB9432549.1 undecaprenyl diphosphate synthase family protein [Microcystis aeruginosa CS-552/01]
MTFVPHQTEKRYSELYFTNTFFPDLTPADIEEAIHWFQNRERRFGK